MVHAKNVNDAKEADSGTAFSRQTTDLWLEQPMVGYEFEN